MLISSPKAKKISELDCVYLGDEFCFTMTQEVIDKCMTYATEKAPHNDYLHKYRNADPQKTFNQDAYSKLAEFAAQEFLQTLGLKSGLEVDTVVYPPDQKNWLADLGKKIGVKSTSRILANYIAKNKHGSSESWSFQHKNKEAAGGIDKGVFGLPEEEKKDKWFVFATVETEKITTGTKVWIRGFMRLSHVSKLLQDPIKEEHRGRTKVIYDGDFNVYQAQLRASKQSVSAA